MDLVYSWIFKNVADWKQYLSFVLIFQKDWKHLLALCIGGSISVPEESVIEKGKKFRPKTLSEIMVENQIEKTRKLILKAERAQIKIQQRKKEWEEL